MFGANFYSRGTDHGLDDAGAIFQALTAGRTPAEREAAGAMCSSSGIVVDTKEVNIDGRITPMRSCMSFAVAACRHGDKDFLRGVLSQPALFQLPLRGDWRESMEFAQDTLPVACASVLLARGDFESLEILSQGAQAKIDATPPAKSGWDRADAHAQSFLRLREREVETLLSQLAHAKALGVEQFKRGFEWVKERCEPSLEAKAEAYWLAAATQSGSEAALDAALSLGAIPTPDDALRAANQGAFEAAKRMAKVAQPGVFSVNPRGEREKPASICGSMASSFLQSLPDLALRMTEWRDPRSTSMESTLFSYVHHRRGLHRGAQMALAGDFDLPGEDPAASERAKDEIASAIRALAWARFPGAPEVDTDAADRLRPHAPSTAQEMQFLAVCAPDRLPQALDRAGQGEGDKFCALAIKRHQDAINREEFSSRGHPEQSRERSELLKTRARDALFEIFQRDSALLGAQAREALFAHARTQPGMLEEFESEVLQRAAKPATARSRGPLKA